MSNDIISINGHEIFAVLEGYYPKISIVKNGKLIKK